MGFLFLDKDFRCINNVSNIKIDIFFFVNKLLFLDGMISKLKLIIGRVVILGIVWNLNIGICIFYLNLLFDIYLIIMLWYENVFFLVIVVILYSSWIRMRDIFLIIVLVGGLFYVVYRFYKV